jgi:hypothetical protein
LWEAPRAERRALAGALLAAGVADAKIIEQGVNVKALSTFMGHASVAFTLDRYGHLFPGAESEAGGLLDTYLNAAGGRVRRAVARTSGPHPAEFRSAKPKRPLGAACTTSDRGWLLPHSGGFEGLGSVEIGDASDATTAFECQKVGNCHIHLDAAAAAQRVGMQERDDRVTRVEEPLGVVPELLPILGKRHEVSANLGMTVNRNATERGEVRKQLDVRVTFRNDSLHIATISCVVEPPCRFDVLLRHRSPSIPGPVVSARPRLSPPSSPGCAPPRSGSSR